MTPVTLNIIQILCGIAAAVCIFIGIRKPIKQLNGENRSQEISKDIIFNSTKMVIIGLLLFTVTKGITNYVAANEEEKIFFPCYTAALVSTIRYFGFLVAIPFILDYIRASNNKKPKNDK